LKQKPAKSKPAKKIPVNKQVIIDSIKYYTIGIYNKAGEDHMWIMASAIAFNFLICIIPFMLILFSILGMYLSSAERVADVQTYLDKVLNLPEPLKSNITNQVLRRVGEISSHTTITSIIGIIVLLWTSSGLFSTIRDALNKIYKISVEVFYLVGKIKDIVMVLLVSVFFILSVASTSLFSILTSKGIDFVDNYIPIGFMDEIITALLGLLFSFLMFYIIHKIVPHGQVKKKTATIASLSSAIMFELLKHLFTIYLVSFSNFAAVYGAYAAIVSVIFWIYYSSFIFVLGAEIGQLYHERKLLRTLTPNPSPHREGKQR
jgi:membrane protein